MIWKLIAQIGCWLFCFTVYQLILGHLMPNQNLKKKKKIKQKVKNIQGAYNKFPDIFRMSNFIDSTHMKL